MKIYLAFVGCFSIFVGWIHTIIWRPAMTVIPNEKLLNENKVFESK